MHRARALGIDRVVQGAEDKLTPWEALRGELELPAEVVRPHRRRPSRRSHLRALRFRRFGAACAGVRARARALRHRPRRRDGGGARAVRDDPRGAGRASACGSMSAAGPSQGADRSPLGGQRSGDSRKRGGTTSDSAALPPRSPGGLVAGAAARQPRGAHLLARRAGEVDRAQGRRVVAARSRSLHRALQRGQLRRRRPRAADALGGAGRALSGRRQRRPHATLARDHGSRQAARRRDGRGSARSRGTGRPSRCGATSTRRATPCRLLRPRRTRSASRRSPPRRCA